MTRNYTDYRKYIMCIEEEQGTMAKWVATIPHAFKEPSQVLARTAFCKETAFSGLRMMSKHQQLMKVELLHKDTPGRSL